MAFSAVESAVMVGGLSALGAALYSIGIPKDSVIDYETAVKADSFLVMAHGSAEEVARAEAILGTAGASRLEVHGGAKATKSADHLVARGCLDSVAEPLREGRSRRTKDIAMRSFYAAIAIGPLVLAGALAPAAGQPPSSNIPVQLAAGTNSTVDRDSYARKAEDEVREWLRKLHDFNETAEAKGKEADRAAANDLSKARTKTEAALRQLQTAGGEGRENAKIPFEKADRELAESRDRIPD